MEEKGAMVQTLRDGILKSSQLWNPWGWQKVANCLQLFTKREGVVINTNQGFDMTLVKQKSTAVEATKALLPKRLLG
jgi:hypothetical protein